MKKFFKTRLSLTISLVLFVFCVLVATFLLVGTIAAVLQRLGIINLSFGVVRASEKAGSHPYVVFWFLGLCILLGTALTAFLSKRTLNPIKKVIAATRQVAQGDFSVRVELKGIGELEELSRSFNTMTQELSSIETLRGDFVNNFSHEFKTPIVSIRGFAKLLRDGELSGEERREYLDIIIAESERLAELSTNVLNLSRYENMEIVEKAPFRLDEQIRRTIVLMEPKWSAKELTVNVELEEIVYNGSEDLTQQIWLNLLDNAVKFSYPGGLIAVTLAREPDGIRFTIQDEGPGIDSETQAHIFDKFYQGDTSHSKAGYGLGLALVRRITQLCGGTVEVQSELGHGSVFLVRLKTIS